MMEDQVDGLRFLQRSMRNYRPGIMLIVKAARKGETLTEAQQRELGEYLDGYEAGLAEIRALLPPQREPRGRSDPSDVVESWFAP